MSAGIVLRVAVFLLAASALLWFMNSGDDDPETPASPSTAATETPAPQPAVSPSPSPSASPSATPTLDPDRANVDGRRGARLELATDAARAFARPSAQTPQQQWWDQLRPYLDTDYVDDFEYIDAQRVPFTKITGRARLEPTAAPETLLTLVRIPTDAGDYAVEIQDAEDGLGVTVIYPWQDQDES